MQHCVFLGGEPGAGKTTTVRHVLASLGPCGSTTFTCGSVRGQLYPQTRVLVLGLYPEHEVFAGTDRLSTGVLHDLPALCTQLAHPYFASYALLSEGSRLFSQASLAVFAAAFPVKLVELQTRYGQKRRDARGPQRESFVRGIQTQVRHVFERYEQTLPCYHLCNDTVREMRRNVETILTLLKVL